MLNALDVAKSWSESQKGNAVMNCCDMKLIMQVYLWDTAALDGT